MNKKTIYLILLLLFKSTIGLAQSTPCTEEHPCWACQLMGRYDSVELRHDADSSFTLEEISLSPSLRWELSANLLSWVAAAPSLKASVLFHKSWRGSLSVTMPWWSFEPSGVRYCLCLLSPQIAYYFRTDTFTGFHCGLYLQGGWFHLNGGTWRGDATGAIGTVLGVGMDAGYTQTLRTSRWAFDFSIGIGYLDTRYDTYYPEDDCYIFIAEHRRSTARFPYVTLSRAEIALCYRFN